MIFSSLPPLSWSIYLDNTPSSSFNSSNLYPLLFNSPPCPPFQAPHWHLDQLHRLPRATMWLVAMVTPLDGQAGGLFCLHFGCDAQTFKFWCGADTMHSAATQQAIEAVRGCLNCAAAANSRTVATGRCSYIKDRAVTLCWVCWLHQWLSIFSMLVGVLVQIRKCVCVCCVCVCICYSTMTQPCTTKSLSC